MHTDDIAPSMGPPEPPAVEQPPAPPAAATRAQLRALSHPLRLRIMERVGRRGTARAADIAEDLGLAANSVSYHLRILARGGVIREAPEAARDKRDRVWKISQPSFDSSPRGAAQDTSGTPEEYELAADATSLASFDWMRDTWAATLGRPDVPGAEGPSARARRLFATTLRLSPDQARELGELVTDQIMEYCRLNRDTDGANRPGDPDSPGGALDYQVLFALSRDHSGPRPDHVQDAPGPAPEDFVD